MTTAEIIKGLKAVRTIHNGNYAPFIDEAIKELKVMEWIPCSERLPKEHKWVLCSCRASIYEVLMLTNKGWEDGYDKVYMQGFVVAWMPLPEPYKVEPQESDHKCHTCKHYTSGERDGSCGSYICKHYSDWESEE